MKVNEGKLLKVREYIEVVGKREDDIPTRFGRRTAALDGFFAFHSFLLVVLLQVAAVCKLMSG